jgi:hypothetical protein
LLDSFCSRIVNIFFCDTFFSIAINLKSFCDHFICCCTCKTIALFIFKLLPLTHKEGVRATSNKLQSKPTPYEWCSGGQISGDRNWRLKVFLIRRSNYFASFQAIES